MPSYRPPAVDLDQEAIISAIRSLPGDLQTAFVTRREHEQQNDSISATMRDLKSSIDELAKAVRQDTVPRRDYDDFVQQSRVDRRDIETRLTEMSNFINASNARTQNRFLGNANQYTYWLIVILGVVLAFALPHLWH
jgi:hypothetical protein